MVADLEKKHQELIKALTSSDVIEVSHLHMLLIGHSGVGKTSIRKHLQNIPFNEKEKSTIIMEQELLCQVTIEASTDSSLTVFRKSENVYKSEPDKVFLTLWDTGGQPMFQDLLPCFAKLRSIYGIVFRLCDLLENHKAVIRPVCSLQYEQESLYTCVDHIYRCLAFLDSFSASSHYNIPPELKTTSPEHTALQTFPRVALIGTFKDKVPKDDSQLKDKVSQLRDSLESKFSVRTLLPESVVFEIDNTRSGQKYEDPGMMDLRKQIVACTKSAKAKIPSTWISFKVDLERESRLKQPCTGVVRLEKAIEIARKYNIPDPTPALCYFHKLGIFVWYNEKESLKEYVIIEPENLVTILGTIFNPEKFIESPDQWKKLQAKGILDAEVASQLLIESRTELPWEWVVSFFKEHHLGISLDKGYFIPSMLQELPICYNHLHQYDIENSVCTVFSHNSGIEIAPLYLVFRSNYTPPGFFPRLMTALAGIQDGKIVWKLSANSDNYKNMISFIVNDQACITFTEFLHCVRIHFFSGGEISQKLCHDILSQLKIQLQRIFLQTNELPVSITFACFCSKSPHFLPSLPSISEDNVHCSEHPNIIFELTKAHKLWLQKLPPKIGSNEG